MFNFNVFWTENLILVPPLWVMGECGGLGFGEGLGVNSLDFRQPYCKVVKATLIPLLQEDKSTGYSKLYSTLKPIKMDIKSYYKSII